jgi:hypothetical protein
VVKEGKGSHPHPNGLMVLSLDEVLTQDHRKLSELLELRFSDHKRILLLSPPTQILL